MEVWLLSSCVSPVAGFKKMTEPFDYLHLNNMIRLRTADKKSYVEHFSDSCCLQNSALSSLLLCLNSPYSDFAEAEETNQLVPHSRSLGTNNKNRINSGHFIRYSIPAKTNVFQYSSSAIISACTGDG